MKDGLLIRPAEPADRSAMERICAHTFEWGDYVPEAWDEWLADQGGLLIVGEVADRVVSLSKITFQTTEQVWLEGMRVEPAYRRRGIAGQFLDYSIAYARQHGARVVRLGTGYHNRPAHSLAARAGMERIGTYVLWVAEPVPRLVTAEFLEPGDWSAAEAFLGRNGARTSTPALYSVDWCWEEFSAKRLTRFLKRGQVAARFSAGSSLSALATLHGDPDDGLWIGFVDGDPARAGDVADLPLALRGHAHQAGAHEIAIMLPDLAWLRDAFNTAGFGYGDYGG